MSKLPLTLACWDYDRTRPLIDGRVQPQGIDLNVLVLRPAEMFARMLEHKEYQVSELSLGHYTALRARGDTSFVGLPIALSRIFRHSCLYVRTDGGIPTPLDLKGKRIGTVSYGSTGAVFIRGLLQHDYGVRPEDMHWLLGSLDTPTPRQAVQPNLPSSVSIDFLSEGQTLEGLLRTGELDALFSLFIPASFQQGEPHITRLFPNYKEVEQDYYRRTGIFPIMHTVVVRDDVHREHPWVARSIYEAFREARDLAVNGIYDTDALRLALPWLIDHVEEARRVFGPDFWAYGVEPNRATYAAIGQYVFEQGLAPRAVTPEELFWSEVR